MDHQFAWTTPGVHLPPSAQPAGGGSSSHGGGGHYADRQRSSSAFSSSGPSPYPSPLVPGERSSSATVPASVLQPVKEDLPFTSPPLSSGGMASMAADPSARLGSGYQPPQPGAPASGFGELVATSFGSGSIGEIWGDPAAHGALGRQPTTASPFRHDAFLAAAAAGAPFAAGGAPPSGLTAPFEQFTVPPPSTAALIAARPYTANAASALVFMSQSGSLDGADGPGGGGARGALDSPVFAADAMLQRVSQDGGGRYVDGGHELSSYARPGSSSQYASQGGGGGSRRMSGAQAVDPQQSAYGAFPAGSRNSFAMENLSLQQRQPVFGGQPPPPMVANPAIAPPNYHQAPAAALHYSTAPPASRPSSSHSRPQSQGGGPDRRALQQQQQQQQTNGPPNTQHVRSNSLAGRAHPYSRPAFNSLSAATPAGVQGWGGAADAQTFAQLYQQQAAMRPQTSDGVPMSVRPPVDPPLLPLAR